MNTKKYLLQQTEIEFLKKTIVRLEMEKTQEIKSYKTKIQRLELENKFVEEIKKKIAEYNYKDPTRDGAFYFMKKITALFFDAPAETFEKKQYFKKYLK